MTPVYVRSVKSALIQAQNWNSAIETEADVCECLFLKDDLENGEEVATCPSCSLIVRVIYDKVRKPKFGHLALLFFLVSHLIWCCLLLFLGGVYVRRACRSSTFCTWKETGASPVLKPSLSLWLFVGEVCPQTLIFDMSRGDKWTDEFVNMLQKMFYSLVWKFLILFNKINRFITSRLGIFTEFKLVS